MVTLIPTCTFNGMNAFDYLTAQAHAGGCALPEGLVVLSLQGNACAAE